MAGGSGARLLRSRNGYTAVLSCRACRGGERERRQGGGGGGATAAVGAGVSGAVGAGDGGANDDAQMAAIAAVGALPTCRQSAPARYEFRGGIEAYCSAAARALRRPATDAAASGGEASSGGRFVCCEGGLALNAARVHSAAQAAGLRVLEQLDVVGREGKRPLFGVYVMCHADDRSDLRGATSAGAAAAAAATATTAVPASGGAAPPVPLTVKQLVVRTLAGPRTAEYCALMRDMGMPHGEK